MVLLSPGMVAAPCTTLSLGVLLTLLALPRPPAPPRSDFGCPATLGPGVGGAAADVLPTGGGGHGGTGGEGLSKGGVAVPGGGTYDDPAFPQKMGSGGGGNTGGAGGGVIVVTIGSTLEMNGGVRGVACAGAWRVVCGHTRLLSAADRGQRTRWTHSSQGLWRVYVCRHRLGWHGSLWHLALTLACARVCWLVDTAGGGGGSGGSVRLTFHHLFVTHSLVTASGGIGGGQGGGGGGGIVTFTWTGERPHHVYDEDDLQVEVSGGQAWTHQARGYSGAKSATPACGPGKFGVLCAMCPPGTFKSTAGQFGCTNCAGGTYYSGYGATECLPCPPGTYVGHALAAHLTTALCVAGYVCSRRVVALCYLTCTASRQTRAPPSALLVRAACGRATTPGPVANAAQVLWLWL